LGFTFAKSIFLTRALGEENFDDEDFGKHVEKGRGIELEIMVREPRLIKGW
jgi:hypothetical protein